MLIENSEFFLFILLNSETNKKIFKHINKIQNEEKPVFKMKKREKKTKT